MATFTFTESVVDADLTYEVDFEITSWGSPPHMGSLDYPGDPGDPPEIDITSIIVTRTAEEGETFFTYLGSAIPEDLYAKAEDAIHKDFDFLAEADYE